MKKYFGVVLLLVLSAGILMSAQKASPASDFQYSLNSTSTGIIITKYKGNAKDVIIPSIIEDYPIEEIGSYAFSESTLESITIPDSVGEICVDAFLNCKNLKTITIGSGIKAIGSYAFGGCVSLTRFDIGVKKLEQKGGGYAKYRNQYYGYRDDSFLGCTSLSLKEQKKIRDIGYTGKF